MSPVWYASTPFAVSAVEISLSALREHFPAGGRAHEWHCDVHLAPCRTVRVRPYITDYSFFVGLRGSRWLLARVSQWRQPAAQLSSDLATRALDLRYENVGDTLSYRLYDHGRLCEEFAHCIQEERAWFDSSWRPDVQPTGDERRFVDATFRELGLRMPYPWLERLPDGRILGRAGFDLDFSGQGVKATAVFPPHRVPGELPPEQIAGLDLAVL